MVSGQLAPAQNTPVPVPDESSDGYWEAARRQQLVIQRCEQCGTLAHPPRHCCTRCQAMPPRFTWQQVIGSGRVHAWTVAHIALLPSLSDATPYLVAEIELDEDPGVHVVGRLYGLDPADLRLGMPVRVVFDRVGEDFAVPAFEAAAVGVTA